MNVEIKLVGEINDAKMQSVLNVLTSNNQVAASKAVAPKAVKAETAAQTEEEAEPATAKAAPKAAAKPAAAKAPKAAAKPAAAVVMSDEDKIEALNAMDAEEQLATVQAEVTKHSKKGKTADIKKLLAIFAAPKVSELDPATYGEFYELVLRFAGGETSDDIVESYDI